MLTFNIFTYLNVLLNFIIYFMSSSVPQEIGGIAIRRRMTQKEAVTSESVRMVTASYDMNRPMHTAVTLGLLFVSLISTTERE